MSNLDNIVLWKHDMIIWYSAYCVAHVSLTKVAYIAENAFEQYWMKVSYLDELRCPRQ